MNRRGFLKSIGKVVVGCAIVPSVAKIKAKQIQPHPFSPLKSSEDFDALMKRVRARCEEAKFIRVEYEGMMTIYNRRLIPIAYMPYPLECAKVLRKTGFPEKYIK